ncbi:MAG: outer membrane protein assembly factor BamD [Acidobacteria bacterium]|nr:outer membrane protein assembly factor BamD [Acidobacteriota bacterium]
MKLAKLVALVLVAGLLITGCGRGKKQVGKETRRDNELLNEGMHELQKNKYIVGRLLLNTLITTYPDSPYVPISKLAIADSFYREGTSEALAQAEVEYKDFANFFPTHPLADDALLQVAYINMRQMLAPNRDVTAAKKAEKALLAILQRYPNTDHKEEIQQRLRDVRNHIAEHHMEVARLQMRREQLKGARNRLHEVAEEYPEYTKMDEALFRLGNVLFELEEPDEAAKYLARLVRQYPNSEYRQRAAELIETMGKPVPESEPIELVKVPVQENPGFFGSILGTVLNLIANPNMHVPHNGVLLKEDITTEDLVAAAENYSRPTTVVTPESGVVTVGPSGPVTPGARAGGRGEQTVTVGGAEQKKPDQKDKKSNEKKKP